MLPIPLKKAVPLDLVSPISSYLAKQYNQEEADRHIDDLRALQQLRNDATGVTKCTDDSGRNALLYYEAQLAMCGSRLPIGETQLSTLNFGWNDAFVGNKKSAAQSSVYFERAALLYNLGAYESHLGASAERKSDEGLRIACRRFQIAAGYFDHLCRTVFPPHTHSSASGTPVTPDLSESGLAMVTQLMLGQAQACYYDMAVRKKDIPGRSTKPTLLAKLAAQAGAYYEAALNASRTVTLNGHLDASWPSLLEFKFLCFQSAAQFWYSQHTYTVAHEQGSGYAEEVARLQVAERLVDQALALVHGGSASTPDAKSPPNSSLVGVSSTAEQLKAKIQERLGPALEDVNKIYIEVLPSASDLAPIGKLSPVKPLASPPPHTFIDTSLSAPSQKSIEEEAAAPNTSGLQLQKQKPLLLDLLPRSVMHAVQQHRSALQDVWAGAEALVKQVNKAARAQLAAVGLPGSIAAHAEVHGFPEETWSKVEAVQQSGGAWNAQQKLIQLDSGAMRAGDLLCHIQDQLTEEYQEDDRFRVSPSFNIPNSSRETGAQFQTALDDFAQTHKKARLRDEELRSRLALGSRDRESGDTNVRFMEGSDMVLLGKSRRELDALMPQRDLLDDTSHLPKVDTTRLSAELGKMAKLMTERNQKLAQMKAAVEDAGGTGVLEHIQIKIVAAGKFLTMDNSGLGGTSEDVTALLEELFATVRQLEKEINTKIAAQPGLMKKVLDENTRFVEARSADTVTVTRARIIESVERAVATFNELQQQLNEGCTFYADLVDRLQQMEQTVAGFVYAQVLARRDAGERGQRKSQLDADAALAQRLATELQMEEDDNKNSATSGPESSSSPTPRAPPPPPPSPHERSEANPPPFPSMASLSFPPVPIVSAMSSAASLSMSSPSSSSSSTSFSLAPPPFPSVNDSSNADYLPSAPPSYGDSVSMSKGPPATVDEGAIARLMDMGFPRDKVLEALGANNYDERRSLNQLLGM